MLIVQPNSIFKESSSLKREDIKPEEIVLFLNEEVQLQDVTFERIFDLILRNHSFFDIVFYRALGGYSVKDFELDFLKDRSADDEYNEIQHLELKWAVDLHEHDGQTDLSFLIDFSGVGDEDDLGYSLALTPINEYKHLVLRINSDVEFYDKSTGVEPILKAKRNMTLYDVIRALLYEITFYGSPNNRSIVLQELDNISDHGGVQQSITFDELFNNVKDDLDGAMPVL